jgi:hypothetical protein
MTTSAPQPRPYSTPAITLAWVVAADMGYGHRRAVYPLRQIAMDGILVVGKNDAASKGERALWLRLLRVYEALSRARGIPVIGKQIFQVLDSLLHIPSSYPSRNLSRPTFQVELLDSLIRQGLCAGMLEHVAREHLPIVTSFFAPAIAADKQGTHRVFCIICDADLNRVWVAKEPWDSRIAYFAPCGKAAQRLKAYGVPEERIFLTGFPLPTELLGGQDFPTLRADLGQRLHYLDPSQRFWPLHNRNVEHFLGKEHCTFRNDRVLTITYAVGGAGAQKEIGAGIAASLAPRIRSGALTLNLMAGTRTDVRDYFVGVAKTIAPDSPHLRVYSAGSPDEYFMQFAHVLRGTDILWTKPSELSFYCALGIPIVMTPPIGSQERFNRQWLFEMQAGIKQEAPEFTNEWLFDRLNDGLFAEMAWSGFLKARKLGTYKILEVLQDGKMTRDPSPVIR